MRTLLILGLLAAAAAAPACTGAKAEAKPGSRGAVTIEGATFSLSDVTFVYEPSRTFRVEGMDARDVGEDCLPGVKGGIALYGRLPEGVNSPVELSDKELPLEFTGNGRDRNLCFAGSNGRLGVEQGTVKFGRVFGGAIQFTFSGEFTRVDGKGSQSELTVHASGSGTAAIR
jgi:hypothetical protein